MARTRSIRRIGTSIVAVAACAGLLASCSSSGAKAGGGTTSGTSASSSTGDVVNVKNFSFEPGNLTVAKGTTVTWKFDDAVQHNVTASNNAFKSTNLNTGGSYSFKFNSAGTYNYICTIHQYMKGTITVK